MHDRPEIEAVLEMESINSTPRIHTGKSSSTDAEDGVFLTWKDLWVTVVNGKNGRPILQGLTGFARPGELLAIMGPSGCGKSALLNALAGILDPHTRKAGDILINGHKQTMAYGTSAYVTQDEALIHTLTVTEAVYYSAQLRLPDTMSRSEKKQRAETTIREMGLQDAMNTRIGGWGNNGLSGGEKRRLSICIEILTRPRLLFLDEPTSGLDSAGSYHVMRSIASLNRRDGVRRTIIASIHQPSSEVFQLFHSLFLLSAGKTVYFGTLSAANEFFASNGFPCPTLQNPSDHFLKTINKDFDKDIEEGFVNEIPTAEVINILVNSYKSSDIFQHAQTEIAQICKQHSRAVEKEKRHVTFFTQCHVLTRRSFINMYRDPGYYRWRLAVYIALTLTLAVLFNNLGLSYGSIQARGALLLFVTAILTFMTIGGFPSFVEEMKVFERERLNGHYGIIAFVLANTISAIPFLIVISLIPGTICYYIPGLQKGFQHFFFFISTLFASMMLIESLMMVVASLVPNFLTGIIVGAGIQGIMMLVAGFFRSPADLPKPVLKYPLHHIAFHKYAYQGLLKNEFEGLRFENDHNNNNNNVGSGGARPMILTGEDALRDIWHVEMATSKWVDLGVLFAMVVFYRVLFLGINKLKPKCHY
ncbi:ABC transporter G family member 1-like [Gossypium arboreum]|uniref:ABC transporter G family member 1-like n=1 Tax=Gossypium arboreum TaxID=29729 RepID=UPI0022F1740A|nr:ABC transporter G family member 1-like [Gossypium arboreum]